MDYVLDGQIASRLMATNSKKPTTAPPKSVPETALVEVSKPVLPPALPPRPSRQVSRGKTKPAPKEDLMGAEMLRERSRHLAVSLFFREQAPVRSLGFTSALSGEGKTFLARMTAAVLADDSNEPVTLVECNWDNPSLHKYYGLSPAPGLAEWVRGECRESDIRHQVGYNLTVIPAGDAGPDAVRILRHLRHNGLLQALATPNEFLVVDLPSIITTGYGSLAAGLVESLLVVVRAGVTPDHLIAEACAELGELPVEGIILNQVASRIPRWIRQLL